MIFIFLTELFCSFRHTNFGCKLSASRSLRLIAGAFSPGTGAYAMPLRLPAIVSGGTQERLNRKGMSGNSSGRFEFLGYAIIFRPDDVFAIGSFEPPHGEMTSRHFLKMLDEGVVHDRPA